MRHGKLPRLRPPRVESWRARRGGLEGAGKSWGLFYERSGDDFWSLAQPTLLKLACMQPADIITPFSNRCGAGVPLTLSTEQTAEHC